MLSGLTLVFLLLNAASSDAQKEAKAKISQIRSLKAKIDELETEIASTKMTVSSLDRLQTQLGEDLRGDELRFRNRFEKVIHSLLNWPNLSFMTRFGGWIEQDNARLVLVSVRDRLVREPLEMISDRELKIKQATELKTNFSEALKSLESKESLLADELTKLGKLKKKRAARSTPDLGG